MPACLPPAPQAGGEASRGGGWAEGAPAQARAGLSAVFAELIQPKFQLKARWACWACWAPLRPLSWLHALGPRRLVHSEQAGPCFLHSAAASGQRVPPAEDTPLS